MPGKDESDSSQDNTNGHYDINHNGNHNGNSNHRPDGGGFEEDDEHEHIYANIIQTHNLTAYAEAVHQVITLEFHDRGLSLDLSHAEAQELGRVLAEVVAFLSRRPTT